MQRRRQLNVDNLRGVVCVSPVAETSLSPRVSDQTRRSYDECRGTFRKPYHPVVIRITPIRERTDTLIDNLVVGYGVVILGRLKCANGGITNYYVRTVSKWRGE